jgi:hypothetical protein
MNNFIVYAKLALLFFSLFSFVNGLIYRLYALNWTGLILGLILTLGIFVFIYQKFGKRSISKESGLTLNLKKEKNTFSRLLLFLYTTIYISGFFLLFKSQTDNAIVSPWEVLSSNFFILYFFLTLILIIHFFKTGRQAAPLLILHFFLSFSTALFIYKLGYGFDPFVHEAAMKVILEKGVILPKKLYYLSLYGSIVPLSKFTGIDIGFLNKIAVPCLAGFFLPLLAYHSISRWFNEKYSTFLTVLLGLTIPFSFFIMTTPQNLSFLFLVLAVIIGLKCDNWLDLTLIYTLSLSALLAQPVSGIPAVLFALAITYYHADRQKFKKTFYTLLFAASSLSLPAAFLSLEKGMGFNAFFDLLKFKNIFSFPIFKMPSSEHLLLNYAYLYIQNIKFYLFLLIIAGIFLFWRNRRECKKLWIYLFLSAGLMISYLLVRLLDFDYLIAYERQDYANRILITSTIFLIPFMILSLHWFVLRFLSQNLFFKYSTAIFLSALITASFYGSYPRYDNYHNSHGYSVSRDDIETVRLIEEDAEGDYIVLANQQVSAAALREFGFKKYYNDNSIFYYPIPTGGEMYNIFLKMIQEKPEKELIKDAMRITNADTGYFVVNKYWWASKKIIEEAKISSDSYFEINNGSIYVFKYLR